MVNKLSKLPTIVMYILSDNAAHAEGDIWAYNSNAGRIHQRQVQGWCFSYERCAGRGFCGTQEGYAASSFALLAVVATAAKSWLHILWSCAIQDVWDLLLGAYWVFCTVDLHGRQQPGSPLLGISMHACISLVVSDQVATAQLLRN